MQWLAEEGRSAVSLRCTPAYGSEVGVCDAGSVGMAETMTFRVRGGPMGGVGEAAGEPSSQKRVMGARHPVCPPPCCHRNSALERISK